FADEIATADHTVTYQVPTTEELQPYSSFDVTYKAVETANEQVMLSYTLPATLIGQPREFQLSGPAPADGASFSLRGPDADMTCVNNQGSVMCRVVHHNVTVDLVAVKAALDKTDMTPQEKQGHLKLASFAAREGGDLVGVMTYVQGINYKK
ncbi:MAG: hypothetical protein ACXWSC_09990, partial [Bdellovibrionota bacterium]